MNGCIVMRGSPMHIGHQAVIEAMIADCGVKNCRLVLGSAGHELSMRHIFSYAQRASFVQTVYPELCVMPLSDFPTDEEWLRALDDLIVASRMRPAKVVFYGGCKEDVEFFIEDNREVKIFNRFDGTTPEISATKIRDYLIEKKPVAEWIDPRIASAVEKSFSDNWEEFRHR